MRTKASQSADRALGRLWEKTQELLWGGLLMLKTALGSPGWTFANLGVILQPQTAAVVWDPRVTLI